MGRKLPKERVREIGGGRIYLGTQAREINLVDELGGLNDAVACAAKLAGIEKDYKTIYFKAFPGFLGNVELSSVSGVARTIGNIFRATDSGFDEVVRIF